MKFSELNINQNILKALEDKGYQMPTPIQEQAIPHILARKDLLGVAQTGTGKTAAFAIPIIQVIDEVVASNRQADYIRALILTPTRELAIQIDENIADYNKYTRLKHAVIFGGVKQGNQVDRLERGLHILTATPGRLLDLIDQGHVDLSRLDLFVLDEADRMLDMGFIHDVKRVLSKIPAKRQSLFFSATMPENIIALSKSILDQPIKVEVTPASTTAETVSQTVYFTNKNDKPNLLQHIILENAMQQVLVFTRTKHGADRVAKNLVRQGISAASIHGDKAQAQRQKALNSFKDGHLTALVATDIAARGIDIEKLNWVINYEIPNLPENYVHRIGRSGRAGESGNAISIADPEEIAFIRDIEKEIGLKIKVISNNPFPQTDRPMNAEERKQFEAEKQQRKNDFFANRRASMGDSRGNQNRGQQKQEFKPKQQQHAKPAAHSNQSESKPFTRPAADQNDQAANQAQPKQNGHFKPRQEPFKPKRPHSTEMSDNLKSKFMFPIEK